MPKLLPIMIGDSYQEGSDVEMYCTLMSKNVADIKFNWFKDDVNIDQLTENLGKLKIETNNNRGHSFLSLTNITDKDAGEYTCMAENSYGSDKAAASLIVSGNNVTQVHCQQNSIYLSYSMSYYTNSYNYNHVL